MFKSNRSKWDLGNWSELMQIWYNAFMDTSSIICTCVYLIETTHEKNLTLENLGRTKHNFSTFRCSRWCLRATRANVNRQLEDRLRSQISKWTNAKWNKGTSHCFVSISSFSDLWGIFPAWAIVKDLTTLLGSLSRESLHWVLGEMGYHTPIHWCLGWRYSWK